MTKALHIAAVLTATATCAATASAAEFRYSLDGDARVSLAIENVQGERIRNLVSDAPRKAGMVIETWDGRDDNGNPVPTGTYRWRGILRPDEITANWLGAFYSPGSTPWKLHTRPGGWNLRPSGAGGWLSDHAAPQCLYADGSHVYVGCKIAEAGDSIIQCDLDGRKVWGTLWLGLSGADVMCTEGDVLYVACEGGWMGKRMGVNRFNVRTYSFVPIPKEIRDRHVMHDSAFVRESSTNFSGIAGMYLTSNHIVVAFSDRKRLSFFDRKTALWSHDEPYANAKKQMLAPRAKVFKGVCTDADGNIYRCATNREEQCVKVYSPDGKFLRRIGRQGGRSEGRYDPLAMGNPVDVAVDAKGLVWVAENSFLPKRVSVWTREGELVRDHVGTPFYGGGGSLGDDGYAYYCGMRFRLKPDLSGADLDAILFDPAAHPELQELTDAKLTPESMGPSDVRRWRGKMLLASDDGAIRRASLVGEVAGDVMRPRVMFGRSRTGGTFIWQDGVKAESADFVYGSEWAMRLGPDMEIVLRTKDRKSLAVLKPDENLHYDFAKAEIVPLPPALAGVCSLSITPDGKAFIINRGGCGDQGSPKNLFGAVSRDGGRILWTYPNPYPSNTHNSPLPRIGELRHTLGVEGFAESPVGTLLLLNGNKGTRYLFTQEGFFVQELFGDMRTHEATQNLPSAVRGMVFSRNSLSDECFGGWMGDMNGRTYLIEGKDSLNVCELRGTDSIRRLNGGEVALAEMAKPLSETPLAERGPARTVKAGGFNLNHEWWRLAEYAFPLRDPVARVAIGWNAHCVTLHFDVDDPTPFENGGTDLQTLFHSGDALDFRWEGNPAADAKRTRAVAGDRRFVIAPFGDRVAVVRYVYVDASASGMPAEFVSPAGREVVARVEEVTSAKVDVKRRKGGYAVRVDIPWTELGERVGGAAFAGGLRRADLGVIFGDSTGTRVMRRQYLFDEGSQEVSDIPSEVRVNPSAWGTWEF